MVVVVVVGVLQAAMQHARLSLRAHAHDYKTRVGYMIPPACPEFMTRGYLSLPACLLAVAKFLRSNEIDGGTYIFSQGKTYSFTGVVSLIN